MRKFFSAASADFDLDKYFKWFGWLNPQEGEITLGYAALVAVMGLVIVLLILFVLVGLLMAFNKIFTAIEKKGKASEKSANAAPAPSQNVEDDEETVAAIVAAISCIYAEESGSDAPPPFTVRRIRQVKNSKR